MLYVGADCGRQVGGVEGEEGGAIQLRAASAQPGLCRKKKKGGRGEEEEATKGLSISSSSGEGFLPSVVSMMKRRKGGGEEADDLQKLLPADEEKGEVGKRGS